jgi:hypothetical protein
MICHQDYTMDQSNKYRYEDNSVLKLKEKPHVISVLSFHGSQLHLEHILVPQVKLHELIVKLIFKIHDCGDQL